MSNEATDKFIENIASNHTDSKNEGNLGELHFDKTSLTTLDEVVFQVYRVWRKIFKLYRSRFISSERKKYEIFVTRDVPAMVEKRLAVGHATGVIRFFEYTCGNCYTITDIQTKIGDVKFFFHFWNSFNDERQNVNFITTNICGKRSPNVFDWETGYSIYQILIASICDKVVLVGAPKIERRKLDKPNMSEWQILDIADQLNGLHH